MRIEVSNGKARIFTPYNADFVGMIKNIGGRKWNTDSKCWEVPESEIDVVRQYMIDIFGESDISAGKKVDVVVTFKDDADCTCGAITIFGKTVARATGRDSGARVGSDVTMISGEIDSGGSAKNWRTHIEKDSVFKLRKVPESALKMSTEYDITFEIVGSDTDRKALTEEKERLLARLAEIEKLLEV